MSGRPSPLNSMPGGSIASPVGARSVPIMRHHARPNERSGDATVHERLETGERLGQVLAAETDPEMVARVAELRTRQEQDPVRLDELGGEAIDRLVTQQPRKPDRAASRPYPADVIRATGEEVVE